MDDRAELPFHQLIEALLDSDKPFHPRFLYRLSDLEGDDLEALKKVWPEVPAWRRRALLEDVEQLSASDLLLSFTAFACQAACDPDPIVRLLAVRTMWEYEDNELIHVLMPMLREDEDIEVRAAAAGALGRFVFAGEIEEISPKEHKAIEDLLLEVVNSDQPKVVRRYALESLGYSSREEVSPLIEQAYRSPDVEWVASALFAMGRSANEDWGPKVIEKLSSERTRVRFEATRAAGELELREAVPKLLKMVNDEDQDTRLACIWSLSQIGGEGVSEELLALYDEMEDDEEIEFLDNALENLEFTESMTLLPFFDFSDVDDDDLDDSHDWLDDHQDYDSPYQTDD